MRSKPHILPQRMIAKVLVVALTEEQYENALLRSPVLQSLPTEWSPGVDLRSMEHADIQRKYPDAFLTSTLWRTTLKEPPEPCIMTRKAELGCYLAHVQAWTRAQEILRDAPGARVLIMEDDTQVTEKTVAALTAQQADLVWFPNALRGWSGKADVLHAIPEGKRVAGMLAYAVTASGAASLYENAMPAAMHVDAWLSSHVASSQLSVAIMNPRTGLVRHGGRQSLLQHDWNYALRLFVLCTVTTVLMCMCFALAVYAWFVLNRVGLAVALGSIGALGIASRIAVR